MNKELSELLKWAAVAVAIPVATLIHGIYSEKAAAETKAYDHDGDQLMVLIPRLASPNKQEVAVASVVLFSLADSPHATQTLKNAAAELKRQAQVQRTSDNPAEREAGATVESASARAEGAQASAPPAEIVAGKPAPAAVPLQIAALPSRMFIQIYAESQRPTAIKLLSAFTENGVAIPGIENVLRTHDNAASIVRYAQKRAIGVRYFNANDHEAAVQAAGVVRKALGATTQIELQDRSQHGGGPPGQLELWLPCVISEGAPDTCS